MHVREGHAKDVMLGLQGRGRPCRRHAQRRGRALTAVGYGRCMALWITASTCAAAAWWCTMGAWAPCWLPCWPACPLWPARSTSTSTRTYARLCCQYCRAPVSFSDAQTDILTSVSARCTGYEALHTELSSSCYVQADLLEHLGLGAQVPGRLLAYGDAEEAAARLAAAMRAVSASPAMRVSAQSVQMRLCEEEGAAAAAAIVQELAAVPRHVAPLRQVCSQMLGS